MPELKKQCVFSNTDIGLEVIDELIQDNGLLQLRVLIQAIGDQGVNVSGAVRELEVIRYYVHQARTRLGVIETHSSFICQQTKIV